MTSMPPPMTMTTTVSKKTRLPSREPVCSTTMKLNLKEDAIVPFTVTANSDSDEQSDLECLKRVQSLYKPNKGTIPPPQPTTAASDDDEDDFETVRAIFKQFSAYDGGRLQM
ncbi:hypothetical protein A2U01_0058526, partial [Trifolium medium]|nr:hypothetical protein [Trifolium medium]